MEQILFLTADKLRKNIDAAEYKSYVLGLLFLKYVSDAFDVLHQKILNKEVGYKLPADWTGRAVVGDGGPGHEWESPETIYSDEFGDLHWRVLMQSPFIDQELPDPEVLNELGWYASYIDIDGASGAVLTAAQTEHWGAPGVETIDFQVFVRSEETGVVSRFMGELPPGEARARAC